MNLLLASTSTIYGSGFLDYLKDELVVLFKDVNQITFIPYARPSGITHAQYTQIAADFFKQIGKTVIGVQETDSAQEAIKKAEAVFTGGGNTFLLVKQLYGNDLMDLLTSKIQDGTPYLGTSAGSNIAGLNMRTTNDMPIVYPPSFKTLGLVPFNINPHYLDTDPSSTHKGETRETRILEFLSQNTIPVIALREGNWVRVNQQQYSIEGKHDTRIFENGKKPYEVSPGTDIIELLPYMFDKV